MFGREDVTLSLFWSAGGGGAGPGQRAPWSRGGGDEGEGKDEAHRRRPLGTVALRRADLLPLVRHTCSRAVLRLPIEPACADTDGGGGGRALRAPETLPLSISYRREPSAVARRKWRGWGGRREGTQAADEGVGGVRADDGNLDDGLGLLYDGSADAGRGGDAPPGERVGEAGRVHRPVSVALSEQDVEGVRGGTGGGEEESAEHVELASWLKPGVGTPEGSIAEGVSSVDGSPDPWGSESNTLVHRSSRTEHLLPARTTMCVRVERIVLVNISPAGGGTLEDGEEDLVWTSFDFPGPAEFKPRGGKRGGVFVWDAVEGGAKSQEVHWSPAVAVRRESGHDSVPLEWSVEVSFFFFLHVRPAGRCFAVVWLPAAFCFEAVWLFWCGVCVSMIFWFYLKRVASIRDLCLLALMPIASVYTVRHWRPAYASCAAFSFTL